MSASTATTKDTAEVETVLEELEPLLQPEVHVQALSGTHSRVVLEPLERGFGYTLGNALRRVLLSSLPGAAISEVHIENVEHEYDIADGVREDVVEILLNLKGVAVQLLGTEHTVRLRLEKEGPTAVTAGDIQSTGHVRICNPEHVIANVSENHSLVMDLVVTRDRGYVPADSRSAESEEKMSVNSLWLDATYSPVERVAYTVEQARVEKRTDLDKLVIDLETNGTVTPQEALRHAAQILQQQLTSLMGMQQQASVQDLAEENAIFYKSLESEEIGLTARALNCLKKMGLESLGQLVQCTERDLLKTPNLGKKVLDEIKMELARLGLELGMEVEGFPVPDLTPDEEKAPTPAKAARSK